MSATDVIARFTAAVADRPDRLAAIDPDRTLSFAELDEAVTGTAERITAAGAGTGDVVGIAVPRGVDQLVAVLAVLRAGAAYLPLDLDLPSDRLAFMLADADATLLVTPGAVAPAWDRRATPVIAPARSATQPAPRFPAAEPGDPAYVIHTSGSTGRPKGVLVTRGAVAHLLWSLECSCVYPREPAVVAWNASIGFDASVQQWLRICRGDTVVTVPADLRTDPPRLATYLAEHGVTDIDATPTHWSVLADHLTPAHRPPLRLLVGGEALPSAQWDRLAADRAAGRVEAVNVYGPTETTVDATAAPVTGPEPVIGGPLPRVRCHVLDERLRPVPAGTVGELYVAGDGVALGYTGRPVRTAERFLPEPGSSGGSRMYRTGDLVRRDPAGALVYLGRSDRQVKIAGRRVELGEIEAAVAAHPAVRAAAVGLRDGADGTPRIVAWYVGDGSPIEVRAVVAERLPDVLVPSAFVAVPTLPRTSSGKLDEAALPAPPDASDPSDPSDGDTTIDGAAPNGPIETVIAQAWRDVLGREVVLATEDFFALGGHSLMALKVVVALNRHLGIHTSTRMVYQYPRLRDLAARLAEAQEDG